jgi:hypothetical protein
MARPIVLRASLQFAFLGFARCSPFEWIKYARRRRPAIYRSPSRLSVTLGLTPRGRVSGFVKRCSPFDPRQSQRTLNCQGFSPWASPPVPSVGTQSWTIRCQSRCQLRPFHHSAADGGWCAGREQGEGAIGTTQMPGSLAQGIGVPMLTKLALALTTLASLAATAMADCTRTVCE